MMQSSESYLGEHFLRSYGEEEEEEENQTVKTKKAPLREGPNNKYYTHRWAWENADCNRKYWRQYDKVVVNIVMEEHIIRKS